MFFRRSSTSFFFLDKFAFCTEINNLIFTKAEDVYFYLWTIHTTFSAGIKLGSRRGKPLDSLSAISIMASRCDQSRSLKYMQIFQCYNIIKCLYLVSYPFDINVKFATNTKFTCRLTFMRPTCVPTSTSTVVVNNGFGI